MQKKYNILFEYSPAINSNKSGVGYFTYALFNSLVSNNENLKLIYFYFNFLNHQIKNSKSTIPRFVIKFFPSKLISFSSKYKVLPFIEIFLHIKSDFIIFTNYVALPSIKKTPYALVVYDLGYIDQPQYVQDKNLNYLSSFAPRSIINASLIITISEFTKNRIMDVYKDIKAPILVTPIPPYSNADIKVQTISHRLLNLGIKKDNYILFLGTIEPRKNIINLIETYKIMGTKKSLVLAGGKGWKDEAIIKFIDQSRNEGFDIIQTGYISDEEKSMLYENASIFVLPSHYEGFGMPILEAMQYKIPIAVSNIPVFKEVANESVVYFDQNKPKDMADKILLLLNDKKLQKKLISNYSNVLSKYSWDNNAKNVINAINKILEDKDAGKQKRSP